jgi:hypothetical protein
VVKVLVILLLIVAGILYAAYLYGRWQWQQVIDSAHVQRQMDAARNYRRMCRGR